MGTPRLLADGEDRPQRDSGGEEDASQPWPGVEKHEIEGHQRETRRGMRAREAPPARKAIRPVLEQLHVWMGAAESLEVPRTVDVGCELESADDRCAQRHANDEIGGFSPVRAKPFDPASGEQGGDHREPDRPYQGAPPAVDQVDRPPLACTDPGLRVRVEKPGSGDPAIEIQAVYDCGRQGGRPPPAARNARNQNRLVPIGTGVACTGPMIRNCASSGSGTGRDRSCPARPAGRRRRSAARCRVRIACCRT